MFTIENIENPSFIEDSKSEEASLFEENYALSKRDIFPVYGYQNSVNDFLNTKESLSIEDVQNALAQPFFEKNMEEIETKEKTFLSAQKNSLFNIVNYKKRGRFSIGYKKNKHLSSDFDNLQRKIQVHFLTFVVNLCNDALKSEFGSKPIYNFKQIDYEIKKIINHKFVNKLHLKPIKEILKMRISPKNKKFSEDNNSLVLKLACEHSTFLNGFFDIKYLEFFDRFYFNEEKQIDRITFQGKEIVFSKNTKPFYQLIKKYENHKNLLIDSAKSIYFYGYNSLIGNNSFKIMKNESKDIELKE